MTGFEMTYTLEYQGQLGWNVHESYATLGDALIEHDHFRPMSPYTLRIRHDGTVLKQSDPNRG